MTECSAYVGMDVHKDIQQNAAGDTPLVENAMVATDPPCYDNVPYADIEPPSGKPGAVHSLQAHVPLDKTGTARLPAAEGGMLRPRAE